ncbi:hypothetical protein BDF14DRAFT_1790208 [Spinellus fusiger]|nr:hypothetical protein BDF14DRAFT_1790208 [Spinellus fusiger]
MSKRMGPGVLKRRGIGLERGRATVAHAQARGRGRGIRGHSVVPIRRSTANSY